MTEFGIFILVRSLVGAAGIITTSPFGDSGITTRTALDVSGTARPGYEISLQSPDGRSYGRIMSRDPMPVDLDQLPPDFLNAVIAAEDKRFLQHPGVDAIGTFSAAIDTMKGDLRGGSGLAQQTIKNTVVGPEISYGRKIHEAMLALRLTEGSGHREVLRKYLQSAWFGRGVTGAMQAPGIWFGKEWEELSLAETVTLAAMLKGPAYFDPLRHPDRVKFRRNAIIDIMVDQGWLDEDEAEKARNEDVLPIAPPDLKVEDPWIFSASQREAGERRDLMGERGTAELTIDPQWQDIAVKALREEVTKGSPIVAPPSVSERELSAFRNAASDDNRENDRLPGGYTLDLPAGSPYRSTLLLSQKGNSWDIMTSWGVERNVRLSDDHPDWSPKPGMIVPATASIQDDNGSRAEIRLATTTQGAVVILDPRSGEIIATVGGADGGLSAFDRSLAMRQPGSSIKPFLYLAALNRGLGPQMGVEDIERTWRGIGNGWRPRNYDHKQLGVIPMYSALERSQNVATVWLANLIGIDLMAGMAEAAGVYPEGKMIRALPSALGTDETSLQRLTAGYASFVNDGIAMKPHIFRTITSGTGASREIGKTPQGPAMASSGSLDSLRGMLRGVAVRGTAYRTFKDHPVAIAGKTGTTQNHKDAWFVGVTPHLAIGVWLGRDDSKPLPGRTAGGSHAAPIAARILKEAHEAGLIDSDGYRDEERSPDLNWPPALHDRSGRTPEVAHMPDSSLFERPVSRPAQESVAAATDAVEEDPFWAAIATRPPARESWEESPKDRNADLLDW